VFRKRHLISFIVTQLNGSGFTHFTIYTFLSDIAEMVYLSADRVE